MIEQRNAISIHAPRTGSDDNWLRGNALKGDFNPRSPHGERHAVSASKTSILVFQSTLPARGATRRASAPECVFVHFNPRSPHGERPFFAGQDATASRHFNPRSPHGERLSTFCPDVCQLSISIHAPRTGSDAERSIRMWWKSDFNPRSPHGERHALSTHEGKWIKISIHAPRTGSDCSSSQSFSLSSYFNPRSPHGERPACKSQGKSGKQISIHAPRTGSDAGGGRRR